MQSGDSIVHTRPRRSGVLQIDQIGILEENGGGIHTGKCQEACFSFLSASVVTQQGKSVPGSAIRYP